MVRIIGPGGINSSSDVKKKKSASSSSGDFGKLLDDAIGSEETREAQGVSAPAAIDSLLAIQQVSDEEVDKQKAIKYGNDLLDSLEKLRDQLLMGEVSISQLKNIEARIKGYQQGFVDPALKGIINDIEIRVAVELAKYT